LAKVDAGGLLRLINDEKATWTALVPGVINEFLNHPERDRFNLSSLRFAIGYGNLCPEAAERAANELGIEFCDIFGQTESSYLVAVGRIRRGAPPDFRKMPQPMLDLRLVDDAMNDVPPGEPGECVVRGATVMTGYVDDPGATAEAFRGGWLHTGDVLVQHEDGTLTYADRRKYLIKTGGENVYPSEVEQAIAAHEAVAEVCAFGVPDERWGETIKAAVVLHDSGSASAQELADWCSVRLARYKRPHYIEFFGPKELPRNASGKVDRLELASRALLAGHRVT
jgi:fatty-acyl-CoA synthase